MRTRHTLRLPPDLAGKLADYAARKGVSQALIMEAALASYLSPTARIGLKRRSAGASIA